MNCMFLEASSNSSVVFNENENKPGMKNRGRKTRGAKPEPQKK